MHNEQHRSVQIQDHVDIKVTSGKENANNN